MLLGNGDMMLMLQIVWFLICQKLTFENIHDNITISLYYSLRGGEPTESRISIKNIIRFSKK